MDLRRSGALVIVLVLSVAIMSIGGAEAARALPEEFARASNLSSVYGRARFTLSCWFERLASGPSPRGPGH